MSDRRVSDPLIGVGGAAKALHVSPGTIRNWTEKGYLKAVSLPSGVRRIPQSEVDRLLGEMFAIPRQVEEAPYDEVAEEEAHPFEEPPRYVEDAPRRRVNAGEKLP